MRPSKFRGQCVLLGFLMIGYVLEEGSCDLLMPCVIQFYHGQSLTSGLASFWLSDNQLITPNRRQPARAASTVIPHEVTQSSLKSCQGNWFSGLLQLWIQQVKATSCGKCSFILNLPPSNAAWSDLLFSAATEEKLKKAAAAQLR